MALYDIIRWGFSFIAAWTFATCMGVSSGPMKGFVGPPLLWNRGSHQPWALLLSVYTLYLQHKPSLPVWEYLQVPTKLWKFRNIEANFILHFTKLWCIHYIHLGSDLFKCKFGFHCPHRFNLSTRGDAGHRSPSYLSIFFLKKIGAFNKILWAVLGEQGLPG